MNPKVVENLWVGALVILPILAAGFFLIQGDSILSTNDVMEKTLPKIDSGNSQLASTPADDLRQLIIGGKVGVLEQRFGSVRDVAMRLGVVLTLVADAIGGTIRFFIENEAVTKSLAIAVGTVLVAAFLALAPAVWAAVSPVLLAMAPLLALGAAVAGLVANSAGFSDGLSTQASQLVAIWVFIAFVPLATIGVFAGFKVSAK